MPELTYDRQRFRGIRVIPDVHGAYESFVAVTEDAAKQGLFVLQLGDLLDRGEENGLVLKHMLDLVDQESGTWVMGNHDWKHLRNFRGSKVQIKPYQQETIDHIEAIDGLRERFVTHGETVPFWLTLEHYRFAHAGFHREMPDNPDNPARVKYLRERAIFGYVDKDRKTPLGLPLALYDWIERLSGLNVVMLGHHSLNEEEIPVCVHNETTVFFLDGGCGKSHQNLRHIDLLRSDMGHGMVEGVGRDVLQYPDFVTKYAE